MTKIDVAASSVNVANVVHNVRSHYCIGLFMLLAQAINSGVQRKIGAARKHYVQPCKVRRELGEQRFPNF